MSDEARIPGDEVDLDEDLFNFDDIFDAVDPDEDKVDLAQLLAVLEPKDEESSPAETEAARPDDDDGEELIGTDPDEVPAEPSQTVVTVPAAPALSRAWVRGGAAVLAVVVLMNLLSIAVSWERNREINAALNQLEGQLMRSTGDLRQELFHQSALLTNNKLPIAAESIGQTISLEPAMADLEAGDFVSARERLYSLLSIVDRLEPDMADAVEADATYLLAEAWRREAEREREYRP